MARASSRNVIAAIGAAPLMAQGDFAKAALADPVLVLRAHYGDLLRHREALVAAWRDHKAWLADNRDWFTLSRAQQRAVPEERLLEAIDNELDACMGQCVRVMRRQRAVPARTLAGVVAKLSIVAEFIEPGDYPAAHRVLLSAITLANYPVAIATTGARTSPTTDAEGGVTADLAGEGPFMLFAAHMAPPGAASSNGAS